MKTNKEHQQVHSSSHRRLVSPASLPRQCGSTQDKVRELIMQRLLDYKYDYPQSGISSPSRRQNAISL